MRLLLLMLICLTANAVFAADNLGYTPSLNDESVNNAVILPPSGGAATDSRPYFVLPPESFDSNFIIVPLPQSRITTEPSHGRIKTQPMLPIVK